MIAGVKCCLVNDENDVVFDCVVPSYNSIDDISVRRDFSL